MKLVLIGFGTVGQGFTEILRDRLDELNARYGLRPQLVGVATRSRGTLLHPDGLDFDALLTSSAGGSLAAYPDSPGLLRNLPPLELIARSDADVLLEASWTDLQTAQPATDYCRAAFDAGMHVILANKGPVALHYADLHARAHRARRHLRFEGTVMAGTPSLALAQEALAGCRIESVRGILNGTTNYMLTQMAEGQSYTDALATAQQLGYAEADPTADVGGWDAAAKAMILAAALFNQQLALGQLDVTGITDLTIEQIAAAADAGERYKLIAEITPSAARIAPLRLPLSDPLAQVSGATNAITYQTHLLGPVTLIGAGAGRLETGYALLSDLLAIHRQIPQ